ncbi:hypothetical protein L1987_69014 [Smallanthus sonchifolius]|uniref:Uncharacterized protein n=1 Tax=Smallanthus sonchifolius TaxID=185202 RepID=A0ACB9B673_9ASTR|nr:hypothetical protein L1987_69014 [Smallanthus sonchifolius]
MGIWSCDFRYLLILVAIAFIYTQVKLFSTESEYADLVAAAVEAENHCRNQMRLIIDQVGTHQENIVVLEEKVKLQEQECDRLMAVVQDLEKKGVRSLIQDEQVPVAAVVIMACNRADYLERTIKSILKYHNSVALKFPIFVSQDGSNADVRTMAMGYDQLTYMQHLDYEPVITERPGELIAYYKIARHYKWALDQLFYKHSFNRVIILEDDMEIAPDFFDYFEAGADLLDQDKPEKHQCSKISNLRRSDLGSSLGQFFQQYLKPIKLNDVQDKFVKHFANLLKNAKPLFGNDLVLKTNNINGDVRIHYTDQSHFENIARQFGIFEEWKFPPTVGNPKPLK